MIVYFENLMCYQVSFVELMAKYGNLGKMRKREKLTTNHETGSWIVIAELGGLGESNVV